ncbi:MAG: hypothetical protein QOC84_1952 [Bradyrhizobium sp.]|nr:hypothetical protein [Bradyrhizobium sp.]
MVVVKQELSEKQPEVVREVHRLLTEAAKDAHPHFPEDRMRGSLESIIGYAAQQGLFRGPSPWMNCSTT